MARNPGNDGTPALSEIGVETDTRDILAHARQQGEERNFDDVLIIDIDSHHMEVESWRDIIEYIDDDVIRANAKEFVGNRLGVSTYGLNGEQGLRYQDVGGRIPHQKKLAELVEDTGVHRDVVLAQRAYESFHVDHTVVFPTPMLQLGVHPQPEMEVLLGNAYNRWLVENILPQDPRLKSMLFVPFNSPKAALRTVEEFAGAKGVIGFMVTGVRHKPVQHDDYMPFYRALQDRGQPLGFHAGYYWNDPSMLQINRFASMHALSFVWTNMVHLTNWVMNGLPERFPGLDVVWIESGLAFVPFLMQRLDHTYMMRTSEAPLLTKPPGEYIREMYFSSQPMETNYPEALELTFKMINAETQLMFSSDWPHWDFDTPSKIWDLAFLGEEAKRNILGRNAARLFKIPDSVEQRAAAE